MKIAVLDRNDRLIGMNALDPDAEVGRDAVVVPDACDLPIDGTYKYIREEGHFMPVGYGFKKPTAPPVPEGYVLYRLVRTMQEAGLPIGPEAGMWADWYDDSLKRQDEVLVARAMNNPKLSRA